MMVKIGKDIWINENLVKKARIRDGQVVIDLLGEEELVVYSGDYWECKSYVRKKFGVGEEGWGYEE